MEKYIHVGRPARKKARELKTGRGCQLARSEGAVLDAISLASKDWLLAELTDGAGVGWDLYEILNPSSHRVSLPVDGAGKCAVQIRVGVSQKRSNMARRVRPAIAES